MGNLNGKDGKLIYMEVLPEASKAIALMPRTGDPNLSDLLVAGSKTVWRYVAQ